MKVPTYEKSVTKTETSEIHYSIRSGDFPEIGGTYTKDIDISFDKSIDTITKVTNKSNDNLVAIGNTFEYKVLSAKKYRMTIKDFRPVYSTLRVEITDAVTGTKKSTETVFKVKHNGTEYNKIKLNGTIITPKA